MKTTFNQLILCAILILAIKPTIAQETFSKVYYEGNKSLKSYSVTNTFDDSYIIAGTRNNQNFLLKIDSEGDTIWTKVIGPRFANSHPKIISLTDNSFLLASSTYMGANQKSIFCLNFDTNGDTLWSTSIILDSTAYFKSVQQTIDGGFIITSIIFYESISLYKTLISKLSTTGDLLWSKSYSDEVHVNFGTSITQTADSGYIVFGLYEGEPPNYAQAFVMKLTVDGNVSWVNKYIMASTVWDKWYEHVITEDGFIFATLDLHKLVLMKTDFSGNVIWAKKYHTNSFDFAINRIKIQELVNGNFVVLAPDNFIKIDGNGDIIWATELMLQVSDVVESSDNGFLIIGNGPLDGVNSFESDYPQIGVIKTDSLGQGDSDCIYNVTITVQDKTIVANPFMLPSENVGSATHEAFELSSTILTIENGCVAIISDINEDAFENNFHIFPNPSTSVINIQTTDSMQFSSVAIHSILGNQVFKYNGPKTEEIAVDLTNIPRGIYILKMKSNNSLYTRKILLH